MKKKILVSVLSILIIIVTLGILEYFGIIWHTDIFARSYSIRGLDISHYQNTIEWDKISKDYKFIYIKATEGEDFVDKTFQYNWNNAKENGFLVGAYHFFSMSSTGEDQANNFIRIVPYDVSSMPIVIDIEISKDEDKEIVRENLEIMIDIFSNTYGKTPILYVTYETYDAFIKGYFGDCSIWIRDIVKKPKLDDGRAWVFWQYCNRGRIEGIDTYVDINVFYGSMDELLGLTK